MSQALYYKLSKYEFLSPGPAGQFPRKLPLVRLVGTSLQEGEKYVALAVVRVLKFK